MSRQSIDQAQRSWMPLEPSVLPPAEMERRELILREEGIDPKDATEGGAGSWMNDEYQVTASLLPRNDGSPGSMDGMVHLSIKRNDKQPVQDWRDKQAIKNEICGPEREAIEIFPAESRLVDEADQAHLWVFPEGDKLPLGFQARMVKDDRERRREMREAFGMEVAMTKGSQRNWRPGIPTGKGRG